MAPNRRALRCTYAALAVLTLAACAHAFSPEPPAGATSEPRSTPLSDAQKAALAGTWVYAGGEGEQALVDLAVERAVADMGFLARGIAAEALRARARPREGYTLSFDGATVSIASPDHPPERGEVGGPPVTLTDRFGDENQTTFRVEGDALVEEGKSSDGSGRTVFTPSADGRTLAVRRIMQSSRLTAPVDVTLGYERRAAP
jgi:hypothetical protein